MKSEITVDIVIKERTRGRACPKTYAMPLPPTLQDLGIKQRLFRECPPSHGRNVAIL